MDHHTRKMIVPAVALVMMLQLLLPATAWSDEQLALETDAVSAVLMDAYSGKILYEKEPDKQVAPASVTKVATLLVALDTRLR